MKLKLKFIALAAVMTVATSAHADFVASNSTNLGSTLGLLAWNVNTSSYYLRDTGYTLNTFLPNNGGSITLSGDTAVSTFDKTPEAGLTINKTTNANFADSAFTTWLGTQNQADIRWTVFAGDAYNASATSNTQRQVGSVATGSTFTFSNGAMTNAQSGINSFATSGAANNGVFGLSTTGTLSSGQLAAVNGNLMGLSGLTNLLGGVADMYYWVRSAYTGSVATAKQDRFGNSVNFASISLAANGDLTYTLAAAAPVAAVPLPAAAWLLGSGLLGVGGLIRRRKAAQA